MDPYPPFDEDADPSYHGLRPLRWIGALAVFGVVAAALAILAWEAVGDSIVFIGEGEDAPVVVGAPDAAGGAAEPDDGPAATAAPAEEQVRSNAAGQQVYEVQPGDTGSSIAQELYGTQNAWQEIAEYNDLDPTATLTVGQELRLPPPE